MIKFTDQAKQMLLFEECKNSIPEKKLYRCPAGKLTGGIGHNFDDNLLSDAVINQLFYEDLAAAAISAYKIFDKKYFLSISQNRQLAILNLIFNLGESRFLSFKKAIDAIKKGDWPRAGAEILDSKLARQDAPNRAKRIAIMLEHDLFPYD